MRFSFALLEFPSFMSSLPQFRPVIKDNRSAPLDAEGVGIIMGGTRDPDTFEYASKATHVKFRCTDSYMYLMVHHDGKEMVNRTFEDFSEVRMILQQFD